MEHALPWYESSRMYGTRIAFARDSHGFILGKRPQVIQSSSTPATLSLPGLGNIGSHQAYQAWRSSRPSCGLQPIYCARAGQPLPAMRVGGELAGGSIAPVFL